MSTEIIHPLKYTFGYITGFIFLLGIAIYLYMLLLNYQNKKEFTHEEKIWVYSFLGIMIIGFILSYYSIMCSIKKVTNSTEYKKIGSKFKGIRTKVPKHSFGGLSNSRFMI